MKTMTQARRKLLMSMEPAPPPPIYIVIEHGLDRMHLGYPARLTPVAGPFDTPREAALAMSQRREAERRRGSFATAAVYAVAVVLALVFASHYSPEQPSVTFSFEEGR